MEKCMLFKFADEIDHYTVQCTNREIADRETAIRLIHKYCAVDEAVASVLPFSPSELNTACANDIYEALRAIRDFLLEEAFKNA